MRPMLPFVRPHPLAPPPEYARLRAESPVAPVPAPDGRPAWLVTSYDAVAAVLGERRFGLAPAGSEQAGNDTLFQDGEAHARLRRLVSRAFGPRALTALRPRVEELAGELVEAMAGPRAELVGQLATPLSIGVIGELLGVRAGDRARLRALADAASAVDFVFGGEPEPAAAARAWQALGEYAAELVEDRRRDPGDDLLSTLIGVRDAGDGRLGDAELVAMVTTIVSGGYLSARNAVAVAALRLLAENRMPDAAGPGAAMSAVVDEVLRMQAGLTGEPFPRYAHEDLTLAGVRIAAGDLVLVRLEAAHRDPARFPEPDRFLPGRRSGPLLVFGHGPHYCLGAALARAEVAAALGALARRLPGLRLDGPLERIEWSRTGPDAGPEAVPVTQGV
ncbi:cytochrome P450 [Nonomuraea sp. SBT364]|uniref:cytochrome P450 n=1 Tax=Nonomuraea sp. SBT364 TaxID=1580530 RepID=UPI0007C71C7D|nr:cytochrome P450 [Nonomuraea sp. SBT364]